MQSLSFPEPSHSLYEANKDFPDCIFDKSPYLEGRRDTVLDFKNVLPKFIFKDTLITNLSDYEVSILNSKLELARVDNRLLVYNLYIQLYGKCCYPNFYISCLSYKSSTFGYSMSFYVSIKVDNFDNDSTNKIYKGIYILNFNNEGNVIVGIPHDQLFKSWFINISDDTLTLQYDYKYYTNLISNDIKDSFNNFQVTNSYKLDDSGDLSLVDQRITTKNKPSG